MHNDYNIIELCNEDGQLRLAGGKKEYEGRVEICSNGVWGTIYSGGWDILEAIVVCRQLGFHTRSSINACFYLLATIHADHFVNIGVKPLYVYNGHFGAGTGPILYSYLSCDGTESMLSDCSTYSSFYFGASHSNDVGVICQTTSVGMLRRSSYTIEYLQF